MHFFVSFATSYHQTLSLSGLCLIIFIIFNLTLSFLTLLTFVTVWCLCECKKHLIAAIFVTKSIKRYLVIIDKL